jgi:uncharacterized delta-60 repeat protein
MNTSGNYPRETDIDHAKVVAIQPDGKIVVAGSSKNPDLSGIRETVILRYNPDASLDPDFGNEGMVRLAMDRLYDMALQPDGKILLAGFGFAVVRLNTDGTLDLAFGEGGVASTTFKGRGKRTGGDARAVALQADGKILVAGRAYEGWGVARFTPDGSLDDGFGDNGKVEIEGGAAYASAYAIALQSIDSGSGSEERILVGGEASSSSGQDGDFALIRLTMSGALDTSFGPNHDGTVLADFCGEREIVKGIGLDSAGNIVAGGKAWIGGSSSSAKNYGLVRFTPDGILDTSFGDGVPQRPGTAVADFFGDIDDPSGFAIQADGKILLSGTAHKVGYAEMYFGLARFDPDGILDPSFGTGGVVATDASWVAENFGDKLALHPDGKFVVAGTTVAWGGYNFVVLRYWQ